MVEVLRDNDRIKLPGGWRWIPLLPVGELTLALGSTPSSNAIALASILVDHLNEMDQGFLFSLRGRSYSRSVKSIVEYFNPTELDLQVVIRILEHSGQANAFFNLALPANDDGLKACLLDHRVDWGQVLFHYEFSLWDPVRFSGGFLLGLGVSAAAILEVVKDLFDFGVEAFSDPKGAAKKIKSFVEGVRSLSIEAFASMTAEWWTDWNKKFSEALLDRDFDTTGFMLGKLAGDLWQLFTGIRALAKLPGMTIKLARRFGSLFVRGARYSRQALVLLADLIRRLASTVKEAVVLGYGVILDFFENAPLLLRQLRENALLIVNEFGHMLIAVPDEGLAVAGIGTLEPGFLLAREVDGVTTVFARVRVQFEKGLKYAETLGERLSKMVRKTKISPEFAQSIKQAETIASEFLEKWRNTLQDILDSVGDIPLQKHELGSWLHAHCETALLDMKAALPAFELRAEHFIVDLARELAGPAAEARAKVSLLKFAKSTPGLYEALGVADEKALVKALQSLGYDNPAKTLIGGLVSDAVLFNPDAKTFLSIDWTSGLGRFRYANEFEKLMKAGESLSAPEKLALAKRFLRHTFREYALREAILAYVFDGWETKVLEVMYKPFK